jgi:N-acetylneuraminic acid mutarotase
VSQSPKISRPVTRTASCAALLALCSALACSHAAPKPNAAPSAPPALPALPTRVLAASVPLMPKAVTSFGAASVGNAVYAFGGYAGTPHAYSREGQSGALHRLSLDSGEWKELPGAEPTQGTPLVAFARGLARVGGMRALNAKGEPERIVSLAEAALFDLTLERWIALPPLPEARSSHAAVSLGDKLYVLGGWTLTGERKQGEFASQGFVFDLESQRWSALPQPFRQRALAAAVLDGKLVALGGMDDKSQTSRAVHVFDPAQGSWSRAADLPGDGFGIAATSSGDTLYASARDGVLYALDQVDGSWREAARLSFPRFFHQLVMPDAEHVVALGGISGMHFGPRIRPVETLALNEQGPRVLTFTLENPLRGRNRQGVFVEGDYLYVFGGNRSLNQHDFAPDDFVADAGRLDLASMTWERLPDFPRPRQTMQTLVLDERALAVGGFGHDGKDARAQSDAYAFEFQEARWQPASSQLATPRTQFGLAQHGGALWIFGGLDFDPAREGAAQFEHPRSVLRAEPGKPFEPTGSELPRPRRAFGGALLDGRYYLVGGMAEGFAPVAQCDVFEFASARWSEIPCPAPRVSPQLVALDEKLYLAGGSTPGPEGLVENPALEVFDPATQQWSTLLAKLPVPPRNLSMQEFEGQLLLYSAHNQEGVVNLALIAPR